LSSRKKWLDGDGYSNTIVVLIVVL
jgi:hypothetical protein